MQGRRHWSSVVLLILAMPSTVFPGLWLMITMAHPRYGKRTSSGVSLLPLSKASLICAQAIKR